MKVKKLVLSLDLKATMESDCLMSAGRWDGQGKALQAADVF